MARKYRVYIGEGDKVLNEVEADVLEILTRDRMAFFFVNNPNAKDALQDSRIVEWYNLDRISRIREVEEEK